MNKMNECIFKIVFLFYWKHSLQLSLFTYHTLNTGEADPVGPVPIDSLFIYHPDKRHELWRFMTYMFLHAGWFHLGFNLLIQLVFGLPLEMVHGSGRIACIYFSGVLAGSLGKLSALPQYFIYPFSFVFVFAFFLVFITNF